MCSFHCKCVAATSSALIEGHTHRQPWGFGVVGMSLMVQSREKHWLPPFPSFELESLPVIGFDV